MALQESDIQKLFSRVANSTENLPVEVRQVFLTLTSSTLHFRDRLKKNSNITLTVRDVQTTLDLLTEMLSTGRFPDSNNAIHLGLLKIWTDELNLKSEAS